MAAQNEQLATQNSVIPVQNYQYIHTHNYLLQNYYLVFLKN